MKKSPANVAFWCLVVALLCGAKATTAADCRIVKLGACMPEIVGSGPPSADCCDQLREQVPCLCFYFKDPAVGPYFKSHNFPRVASDCGVTIPTC